MKAIDKLYEKREAAYDAGDFEQVAWYDTLISNAEKAELMKDVKISKYRNRDESRINHRFQGEDKLL